MDQKDDLEKTGKYIKDNIDSNSKSLTDWIGRDSFKLLLNPLKVELKDFQEKHEKERGGLSPYNKSLDKLKNDNKWFGRELNKTSLTK